jgi:prepilin-type N-terminal cleavage/methylation domain-containing protein
MTARTRGFTLLEMLAALAIAAALTAGLVKLVLDSSNDARGQQAAQHQQRVAQAASRYIAANYAALVAAATTTKPAKVTTANLVTGGFLPASHQSANAYGQTPCLLVLQPSAGKLEALLVTEGGPAPIPTKDLAWIAASAGNGGGYIPAGTPTTANGAFDAWRLTNTQLAPYLSDNCSGKTATGGSLATALFNDGSSATSDFLYRSTVPGHPELNRMDTPLGMGAGAVAVENDSTDARCAVADPTTQGRIAVSATGRVLSCQAGVWKTSGSGSWKDPVATFATLPAASNTVGDVRMVTALSRAFTWTGTGWTALGIDENGNLQVPGTATAKYLMASSTESAGAACSPNGLIAKDNRGLLLSCQSGKWSSQSSAELAYTETGAQVLMKSGFITYPAGTQFYAGPYTYDAPDDTMMALVERDIVPTKDGLVITNVNVDLNRGTTTTTTDSAQVSLEVQLINRDSGAIIAYTKAMSPMIVNDETTLAATLSKAVPKNTLGYRYQMIVRWITYKGSAAGAIYNRANYKNAAGATVEMTPLAMGWSLDLTY